MKEWPACRAVIETAGVTAPFETTHESDAARDSYEIETGLSGQNTKIADLIETIEVENINDPATAQQIREWQPDIIIDFGTRKVKSPIIALHPQRIVNLHGGDPQHYRGLDTHMWAMYHKDFAALKTTLHRLSPALDEGEIIETKTISVTKNMKIHQFRHANTKICIELVSDMLKTLEQTGSIKSEKQRQEGRYYSFMPTELKNIAACNFEKYTARLDA